MNQQKKSKKKLIIVAVVVVLILAAAFGSSKDDDKKETTTSPQTNEQTQATKKDDAPQEETENEKKVFNVGEPAELEGVSVCVKKAEISKGNDWGKPSKGNQFVFLKILVENKSDKDITISSIASFDAYCDDYKLEDSSEALLALSVDKKRHPLDGTVASGKKLDGYLYFEVPKKWENIELHYTDNIWFGDKVIFSINN